MTVNPFYSNVTAGLSSPGPESTASEMQTLLHYHHLSEIGMLVK